MASGCRYTEQRRFRTMRRSLGSTPGNKPSQLYIDSGYAHYGICHAIFCIFELHAGKTSYACKRPHTFRSTTEALPIKPGSLLETTSIIELSRADRLQPSRAKYFAQTTTQRFRICHAPIEGRFPFACEGTSMRLHIHSTGAHGAAASRALADQMSDAMAKAKIKRLDRKGRERSPGSQFLLPCTTHRPGRRSSCRRRRKLRCFLVAGMREHFRR
jgi:hypothetical protein